jgi:hypothetical protein
VKIALIHMGILDDPIIREDLLGIGYTEAEIEIFKLDGWNIK